MEHISLCGHVSFAFSAVLIFEEENYVPYKQHSLPIELHYMMENTTRIFNFLNFLLLPLSCVIPINHHSFGGHSFPSSRLPAHFPATVKEVWTVTSALFYEWQHSLSYFGGKTSLSVQTFLQLWWIPLIRKYFYFYVGKQILHFPPLKVESK